MQKISLKSVCNYEKYPLRDLERAILLESDGSENCYGCGSDYKTLTRNK